MRSFNSFNRLCEEAGDKAVSKSKIGRSEAKAQKMLDDALRAQAEASIARDEDGKEIRKTRPYYLQNNPTAAAAHRIRTNAANAAVMNAQSRVSMAQQAKANAAQQKAQIQQPEPTETPPEAQAAIDAAGTTPTEPEAPVEAPSPVLTPEQQKAEKAKEREKKKLRGIINKAQSDALNGMMG